MFAKFKQIFNPANKDLRKRIYFTFVVLFIFKLGTSIIVPGLDKDALGTSSLGFLELLNVMGGGALSQFSIFALGVSPYISASIIVSLLQMDIIPYFSELSKQGQTGRAKLNQITRYLGIILAFVQGYMYSFAFIQGGTVMDYMTYALILTAGTALVLWMADQITTKGVGNGTSMIIMAGIIATLPNMFMSLWNELVITTSVQTLFLGLSKFLLFVLLYVAILVGIVFVETSERRIPIQYANKSATIYGKQQSYIPFKLNSASVMPVIFASMLLSIPTIIAKVFKNEAITLFVNNWLTTDTITGFIIYVVCIFVFAYFYTFLQLKPKELAENLNQNGGFIPGIRPGDETEAYIKKVLKRITTIGALSLAIIACIPIVFGAVSSLSTNVSIGGTGLLIVVGVALETYKQIESDLVTKGYQSKRRGRR